jgi:hypothetical protein
MKRIFIYVAFFAIFALPALAFGSEKATLPTQVEVGSTQLPAGEYKVTWTESGTTAQVTLSAKGIPTVTLNAKVLHQKSRHNGIATEHQGDQLVLQAIVLSSVTLQF